MPVSRLNILHWHMMDDESFSVRLGSHPELSEYASFGTSRVYSVDDLKNLITLADKNGVKIIPEISSPSRMRSWFQAPAWNSKNLSVSCG